MVLVEAKVVDSTHLELSKPIATPQGKIVLISVSETEFEDPERCEWLEFSTGSLRSAYSEDEPEYSSSNLLERNLDYGG